MNEGEIKIAVEALKVKREARLRLAEEDARGLLIPGGIVLADLLGLPDDTRPWLVENLMKSGTVVLLTATRKAGKTTLAFNLARALADGDDFLGEYPARMAEGKVELLDFELPVDTAKHWLRVLKIGNPERVRYRNLRGRAAAFNILDPTVRARWAAILKRDGVKVLIVDCLTPVIVSLGMDENSEAGQLIEALKSLQSEAGLDGIIAVHHHGWSGDRARGDSKLEGLPDDLWRLHMKTPDDPFSPRQFSASGRHAYAPKSVLALDPATHELTADIVAGNRQAADANQLAAAVAFIRKEFTGPPWPGANAAWRRVRDLPGHPPRAAVEAAIRDLKNDALLDDACDL